VGRRTKRTRNSANETLWFVSYSDLITAILAVLVLVMSFSKIDIEKIDHANRLMKDDNLVTLTELKQQYEEIIKKNTLTSLVNVVLNDEGLEVIMNSSVQFDVGSSKLNEKGIQVLQPVMKKIVQTGKQREIIIIGHTDATGSSQRNWRLSSERANSVLLYLTKMGLNDKHAHLIAYAANNPLVKVDKNATDTKSKMLRSKNRRVTILIGRSHATL
jgi:flagellar motor protein MotB